MKNILIISLLIAVSGLSASALIISTDTTWANRTGILDQTNGFVEITSGANLTANARVDHDGGIGDAGRVILNGGNLTSTVDYKLPDNNNGNPAYLGILDGIFTANQFESFGLARNAAIEIGANGTFIVETQYSAVTENDGNRYNVGNLILEGSLYASEGLTLNVQDLGGGAVQISAQGPGPEVPTVGFASIISIGQESSDTSLIPVTLAYPEGGVVEVDYLVTGGTAARNIDYTLADGTLTLSATQTTQNIVIVINDDESNEGAETVQITLSNPVNAILGTTQHTFTIEDDDPFIISSKVTWSERTAILDQAEGYVEIVAGGSVIADARVDHDGGIGDAGSVILNGGNFTSRVDYKFPDNNTGNPAFIGIYDGTFTTNQFESFGLARDATIEIGANGTFIVETQYSAVAENDGNRYNVGNLILEGAIYASSGLDLVVDDLGGGAVQITAAANLPTTVDIEYLAATNEIRLTFDSIPNQTYTLETTVDLLTETWIELDDSIPSGGTETTIVISGVVLPDPGNPRRFYRILPGL